VDEVLRERDVKLSSVIGLGSDGASVMMGKRAGVGALLKRESAFCIQVHCVAHRAALAALDAAKAVHQVGVYKHTVSSVYSFYKHSASRTNRLRQLTATLGDEDVKSLKQQCAVRWLSLHRAVEGIKLNWPALVMELHEEAKEDVNLATIRPMVHGSVAALTQLRDSPGPEEERFQADCQNGMYRDVNVTHADDRSRQAFSNVRVRYITHLIDALHNRFPEESLSIITCFDVLLNPSRYPNAQSALQIYAEPALRTIIGHGQGIASEDDSAQCAGRENITESKQRSEVGLART
ncbi:hypothetical protein JOQ06_026751, partial [Pogonophryne albipinna]